MLRRCIPTAANWLSHSVMTRSRPEPGATGSGFPRIQSGGGAPDHRQSHQCVDVIRALVEQAEVALQLAVVGGEKYVGARFPSALRDAREHAAACLIDQFILDMGERVDFANLILGQLARDEAGGAALEVAEAALVPIEPMARLAGENLFDLFTGAGIAGGQI